MFFLAEQMRVVSTEATVRDRNGNGSSCSSAAEDLLGWFKVQCQNLEKEMPGANESR